MANLRILKAYARKSLPSPDLPNSILFSHNEERMIIFDAYPKAKFHFLILPRLLSSMESDSMHYKSLRTLLQWNRAKAQDALIGLRKDADDLIGQIEEEMVKKFGFKWKIWVGFHAVPSMEHLHLHVISADLCSPSLKNKKHYNSFHPKHGFFLHLDEVLEWFEGDDSYYSTMSSLSPSKFEPILKEDLECWKCRASMRNIPLLKAHLQEEWDQEKKRSSQNLKRKRVVEEAGSRAEVAEEEEFQTKRQQVIISE